MTVQAKIQVVSAMSYAETLSGKPGKEKAIVGKPALKMTSQKSSVDGQQQLQHKPSTAGSLLNLVSRLGSLNGSRIVAVLEKLLGCLKKSNGDLIHKSPNLSARRGEYYP